MPDIAVVLLDENGQVLAGEKLLFGDQAVVAVPIVGDERFAFEADFVEEFLACRVSRRPITQATVRRARGS
jgi:hypothetical protein